MAITAKKSVRRKDAAAYVRMSSNKQDASPRQQREQILRLAERSGHRIVQWYEDRAVSGDDIKRRVAFRRMIEDASRGGFAAILCWSQDRFGRFDSIEAGEWVGPLRRAGVTLTTVTDGRIDWNDAIGRLVYTIQQEGKHAFLVDHAKGVLRGALHRARHGRLYPGKTPYGFDKLVFDERGVFVRRIRPGEKLCKPREWTIRLVPSEDASIIRYVRWLFRSYANGASLRSLVVSVNRRHVLPPEGKYWNTSTVRKMLANPVYAGDHAWNRRHVGKYACLLGGEVAREVAFTDKHGPRIYRRTPNSPEDWIVVKDVHPPLVKRADFDRVQARLAEQIKPPRSKIVDPLKSLVVCMHCGRTLTINNHRNVRGKKIVHYRRLECPTYHTKGRTVCRPRSISQPKLLHFLIATLVERVLDPQFEQRLRTSLATWPRSRSTRSPDGLLADAMAQAARHRVALHGSDVELLAAAIRELVERIELRFGRHPRVLGASKVAEGIIYLHQPFTDSKSNLPTIGFSRADFDRVTGAVGRAARA